MLCVCVFSQAVTCTLCLWRRGPLTHHALWYCRLWDIFASVLPQLYQLPQNAVDPGVNNRTHAHTPLSHHPEHKSSIALCFETGMASGHLNKPAFTQTSLELVLHLGSHIPWLPMVTRLAMLAGIGSPFVFRKSHSSYQISITSALHHQERLTVLCSTYCNAGWCINSNQTQYSSANQHVLYSLTFIHGIWQCC